MSEDKKYYISFDIPKQIQNKLKNGGTHKENHKDPLTSDGRVSISKDLMDFIETTPYKSMTIDCDDFYFCLNFKTVEPEDTHEGDSEILRGNYPPRFSDIGKSSLWNRFKNLFKTKQI